MFSRSLRVASRRVLATSVRPSAMPARQLAPAATVGATRGYHEKVLDHYSRPRNVGSMPKGDQDVGQGLPSYDPSSHYHDTIVWAAWVVAAACTWVSDTMRYLALHALQLDAFHPAFRDTNNHGLSAVMLNIRVDPKTNVISDVKFKTFGCGSAIASSSYLTELVRGMTLEQAGRVKNTEIAQELKLPPVKLHCSMLAEDAIKAAISDYYTKNPNAKPTNLAGTEAKAESAASASA
ncbi:FeS cluster assembly scaffold IscU [Colletotrichum lupini]|uniref:FeS cluster assembly scaffold IscU n=1 Tax=Colletotrichum lupini TaxID=145971 RepID=A0A9Q8SF29_9PEZI|nr:FeS cluster assembly scaffold IscU [Colletotrichum lupini]UQC75761.1 FeS cluster assembly scaffold IscU [Colletotrichum lupini]